VRKYYHLPSGVDVGENMPAAERQRLTSVVLDAVSRAVHAAAPAGGTVVATPERPPAREAFTRLRVAADGSAYATPSYNDGGRPVGVPLRRSAGFPFRVRLNHRLRSSQLLREFVRQYRHVAGDAEVERLLGAERWRWTGEPPKVTDADVARRYTLVHVIDHSLHIAHAAEQAANEQALAALSTEQRNELNAEADRRFRAATLRTGKLGTSAEDRELAAYWLAIRDGLLRERKDIDALPQGIRDFLFTTGASRAAGPADYAAVLRLARKLAVLSEAALAGYKPAVDAHTLDWGKFEESVDRYLAKVARFAEAGATVESAKTSLYGMERLYALYKSWQATRGNSDTYPAKGKPNEAADRIDADFQAALAAHGLASPAAFEARIADFLAAFESATALIGLDLLAGYDQRLYAEQQRFQAPGAADQLLAALGATSARTLYAEAAEKAGAAGGIRPDPELHHYLGQDFARKERLETEAAQAKAAADKLVTAAAAGPLVAEEGFDRAALARAASAAEVLRVVRDYVTEHRVGIANTRAELTADRAFAYDLPPLLKASMDRLDIREGTVYHQIISDKLGSLGGRKILKAIVLAVVTIAISVATAGTGTVAVLGAAAVFGIGAWQAVEAYQEYARGHAAHHAGLLDEDLWFGWVLVATLGAGIDLAGVGTAIGPAESALRTFKNSGDVARLAAELKAAGITERLTASIVAQAPGAIRLDAALRGLRTVGGRLNSVMGGVQGTGAMVRAVYFAIRQGIVSLDRFVLHLRAARLIAEGELGAEALVRLREAFEQAGTASRRLRTLGAELGLSAERMAAAAESWGANPAWTLAEAEGQLRALAAGAGDVRTTEQSVLAGIRAGLGRIREDVAAARRLAEEYPAVVAKLEASRIPGRRTINLEALTEHEQEVLGDVFPRADLETLTLRQVQDARGVPGRELNAMFAAEEKALDDLADASLPLYQRMRARTPTERARDIVLRRGKVDQVSRLAPPSGTLDVDHIYPLRLIVEMPGFDRLTLAEQRMIINDPEILLAVDSSMNRSRGDRLWTEEWPGRRTYDATALQRAADAEERAIAHIRGEIDRLSRR